MRIPDSEAIGSGQARGRQASTQNATAELVAGYDQIAADYAVRWGGLRLERALNAFAGRVIGPRRVLDLGCGPGRDVGFLTHLGCQVFGLDLSSGMLAEARRRLPGAPLLCADLRTLPLASHSLDGIWACASLVHLRRAQLPGALDETVRLLRPPAGVLYLALKGGQGERWVTGRRCRRYFFTYYQPAQVRTLLEHAGFRVLESWISPDQAGRDELWINVIAGL